jgi:hypothetical protein
MTFHFNPGNARQVLVREAQTSCKSHQGMLVGAGG